MINSGSNVNKQIKCGYIMSIQEKQAYLRSEIVEKGLCASDFFQYWQKLRLELEDVSFQQLSNIVAKYTVDFEQFGQFQSANTTNQSKFDWDMLCHTPSKEKVKPQILQIRSVEEIQVDRQTIDNKMILGSPQKSITTREVMKKSNLTKMPCLKLQPGILHYHNNIEVVITKLEETEQKSTLFDKLLKDNGFIFIVKTIARTRTKAIGINWQVKRTHSHFQWLRKSLIKFYPGFVVPPLPTATKKEQKFRCYISKLQYFLKNIFRCPELKNSKYFQVFLSYANPADFDAFLKTSEGMSKPKTLNHILNMSGYIEMLDSDSIEKYGLGLEGYLSKSSQQFKSVKTILSQINGAYEGIANLYQDLEQVFSSMAQYSHEFSTEECFESLSQSYQQIAKLAKEHADYCDQERNFMETYLESHFSFERDCLDNLQTLISRRNYFSTELIRKENSKEGEGMFRKLVNIFGEKIESVDAPSNTLEILKAQVGYYNYQLLQQSVRCVEVSVESHIDNFSNYGHSRVDNVDQMQKAWSSFLVELSRLKSRKI